ncbi:hypothetical protein [Enterococcus faecalis]|uniref:hypothetical protein n=1 Tax=Enterococcus faecalis TaxID=1351 RepID=UPI00100F3B4F|nr:hypothetical protein [Enterococcus faecalis]RXV12087.1 hypothetical protein CYQ40_07875 [Enterococcus faecalis]
MEWIKIDNKVKYENNKLTILGKKIEFQYNISELKSNNNHIFVMLEIPSGRQLTEEELCNVVAINETGDIEWRIKNIPPQNNSDYICAPIVGMNLDVSDNLFVTDFIGRKFQVNQETGKLKQIEIVK